MQPPGTVPRARPARGRRRPAALVVSSERITPEADDPTPPPAGTAPGTLRTDTLPPDALRADPRDAAGFPAPPPDLDLSPRTAGDVCTVTGVTAGAGAAPTGELVLDPVRPPARWRAWSRLADLVIRRRAGGRHRHDTLDTGWSMCAPPRRRSLRRWGARA